jgi:dipeptidyl aminopeptidase/acylaminoacyl peptidase
MCRRNDAFTIRSDDGLMVSGSSHHHADRVILRCASEGVRQLCQSMPEIINQPRFPANNQMKFSKFLSLATLALLAVTTPSLAADKRPLKVDDFAWLRDVGAPQLSPDGARIAYTVRTADLLHDKRSTDIWMTDWRDGAERQLTFTAGSETDPHWSPDGRWLAFLSERRDDKEHAQLWILTMAGGEAEKITSLPGSVDDYAISPDGRQVVLVVSDPEDDKPLVESAKTGQPVVIDRFYFKEDITGYLGKIRQHLYLLDLRTRSMQALTPGNCSEARPSWSPDGKTLAFISKRSADPDRNDTFGLYLMAPIAGAAPRLLTTYQGEGQDTDWASPPQWSPDGRHVAFVAGGDPKLLYYAVHGLAIADVASGQVRLLTKQLDRNVDQPHWTSDGKSLLGILEDDGTTQLVAVSLHDGVVRKLTVDGQELDGLDVAANSRITLLRSQPQYPAEVFAFDRGRFRQLTHQNAALLDEVRVAAVERTIARSRDGTLISGFVVLPLDYTPGRRYPAILRIHGGPTSQFTYAFSFEWQLLAANGYVVLAANPRGSTGRGEAFSKAIFADWGNLDAQDVIAHVDLAIANGLADPARLGVGGWSYGGILTNYVIAQDSRFKAATSGASISNILAGYGTDMYIREYEMELGPPWKDTSTWERLSFPFLHADRIKTPTLFLCGAEDFNVPLLNSEQMYQALRSQNVPTQLIIYPGQNHGLTKVSYYQDRFERYLGWYGRHLRLDNHEREVGLD